MKRFQWAASVAVSIVLLGAPVASPGEDAGDFSVLVVANVDTKTADGTMDKLAAAGYEDFVKEGSAGEGFDVYQPGLSRDEAQTLAGEIKDKLGFAMAWETSKLP